MKKNESPASFNSEPPISLAIMIQLRTEELEDGKTLKFCNKQAMYKNPVYQWEFIFSCADKDYVEEKVLEMIDAECSDSFIKKFTNAHEQGAKFVLFFL
jgi:hypothetical protein